MKEILPGIFHWRTFHKGIQAYVHSYYLEALSPAALIDPRIPSQKLKWFGKHKKPSNIYLTNRHHYRHSGQFAELFGCKTWCHRAGLHEFTHSEKVFSFEHGDALPGRVRALQVGSLCPEETAFYIPLSGGILALGDAIVRDEHSRLAFVPDFLMGDDPQAVKTGLLQILTQHLQLKFDHLLLAHGQPVLNNGKEALQHFLSKQEAIL